MGFFDGIGHAISTGYHDIFGGGNNSGPSVVTTTTTQAQLQKPTNPNPQQPQNPVPLFKPNNNGAFNPTPFQQFDPAQLIKANPSQNNQTPATPAYTPDPNSVAADQQAYNASHPSILKRAGNIAGGIVKTIAKPFIYTGEDVSNAIGSGEGEIAKGIMHVTGRKTLGFNLGGGAPEPAIQSNAQQFGDINKAIDIPTEANTPKNFVKNAALVGLTVAAPGLDNAAEAGAASLFNAEGTNEAIQLARLGLNQASADALENGGSQLLTKFAPRIISNAAVGGAFNTIPGVFEGDSAGQDLKNFGTGAAIGGAGGALFGGIPLLKKAVSSRIDSAIPAAEDLAETATDVSGPTAVDELAAGVKGTNVTPPIEPPEPAITAPTNEGASATITTPGEPAVTAPTNAPPVTNVPQPGTTPAPSLPQVRGPEINNPAPAQIVEPPTDNTPAFVRRQQTAQAEAATRQAAEANAAELGAGTTPLDRPSFLHKQDIQAAIDEGEQKLNNYVQENPSATPAQIEQAQASIKQEVLDNIQKLQEQRGGGPNVSSAAIPAATEAATAVAEGQPVSPAVDANGNPVQVSSVAAARQAEAAGVNPNPVATTPAEVQAAQAEAARTPEVPGAPTGELKNARFNQAVIDNTKDPVFKQAFESDPIEKNGQPLSELNDQAVQKVQGMALPELAGSYGKDFEPGHTPVTNPSQYYETLQALRQLEEYPGDPTAADAAANALAAVNEYAYNQGRGLAATKVAYDNLPTSMKVAYITKMVQKAGGDLSEGDLAKLYNAAEVQGQLAKAAQEAEAKVSALAVQATEAGGEKGSFNDAMKAALEAEQQAHGALYDQNREIVDIMQKNLPTSPLGDRIAQSARTMMLSSVGGRAFALTGTGFNTAQFLADNTLSAAFGKGINALNRSRGSEASPVRTSFARPTTLIKGAVKGVKGLARDTFGSSPVKNVDEYLKKPIDSEYSHDATRYGFIGQHVTAPIRKLIRFGVGSHLALTKGVEDTSLEQAARQSAEAIGVPKENLSGYLDFYKSHPPKNVAEEAKQAWMGVNNLHQNGVSNMLGKFASAIDNIGGKDGGVVSGIAKQIRTTVIPFSHYMGGFVDKMLTDRNMFYNVYRIAAARSPQELSDQLAHLTTNVGTSVGLGYGLAKAGVIVNKDQDGNSYDGLYFHVGNRYVPVAFAGQAAMPIIMGATFNHAMQDGTKGQSWPARFIDTTTKMATGTIDNTAKAAGVAGTFGSTTGPNQIFTGDSGKGVPAFVGTATRQHIPGFFGDVNSFLDNSGLNPTHEKPLTKATSTNPNTNRQVTDNVQTEVNKTKAAIPGISQTLPRQQGEKAHDFLDRMLHSGQASGSQVQAQKDAVVQQNQSQADLAGDIPDPNGKYDTTKGESFEGAVAAKIANNEYDKAIPALQQKLDTYKGDNKVDPKTSKSLENKIKELNVTQQFGGNGQTMRKLYLDTNLSDWRDMGDPTSDKYDPTTYKALYAYDHQLAATGVAGNSTDDNKSKFTAKDTKKGRGGSGASLIKDNTIGSTPNLGMVSLGDLGPRKITAAASIPTIQQVQPGQLIKKRAISVSAVR